MESLTAPKTLVDQAYDVILDAICTGTLKPGERLTQNDIARRLNVSRQPIHNVLLVLKAQGFLREAGRRGLAVAPLDPRLAAAFARLSSQACVSAERRLHARSASRSLAARAKAR